MEHSVWLIHHIRLLEAKYTASPCYLSLPAGGPPGSGHPRQGERGSGTDRRGGRRRWEILPRADESHEGCARREKWASEGGHPWWQSRGSAGRQRPALSVRTSRLSMTHHHHLVGNTLAIRWICTLFYFSVFETDGNLVVHEVATQPLTQDMLRSNVSVTILCAP